MYSFHASSAGMGAGTGRPAEDPLRATFVELLRRLNRADQEDPAQGPDSALELGEIERALGEFPPVRSGAVRIAVALGLLVTNGLVAADRGPEYSWQRQRTVARRYRITTAGKKYLLEQIDRTDRVG